MIPLAVPNLSGNEGRYLLECVETNFVSSTGPFVARLEDMVAEAAGGAYAVATSAGTTGLHAALTAVGVRRDDLVVLPAFTFIASANAIAHCGATPWLMDIEPASWTLDPVQVARALERETERRGKEIIHIGTGRRVAAIMPVYALGAPADMDPLVELARRYELPVVADAAAALGARYKGRPIGRMGADLTVVSFNGNKTITAGGGGAVMGHDEHLTKLVRHLTTTARCGPGYDHDVIGFNYRMTNIQAAVGCAQLERLQEFVAKKRQIAERYNDELANVPGVALFPCPEWAESACWMSGILLDRIASTLYEPLRAAEIDARPFWKPIHLQRPYCDAPRSSLEVSEDVWQRILTLPCSTGMSDRDQEHVICTLKRLMTSDASALSGEPWRGTLVDPANQSHLIQT